MAAGAHSSKDPDSLLDAWLRAAEGRYLADLTFPELSRALRALSSCYVERRSKLGGGGALEGAGKRAAFALFYAPIHALVCRHVVRALDARLPPGATIVDLGCGTGASSAAWALAAGTPVSIWGIDRGVWGLREAEWTWRSLGLRGRTTRADLAKLRLTRGPLALLAAYTLNELPPATRAAVHQRLIAAVQDGHALLVLEPLARAAAPWWRDFTATFAGPHTRVDEWRFTTRLPDIVTRLDRATGLDHRELTARSLYVPPHR